MNFILTPTNPQGDCPGVTYSDPIYQTMNAPGPFYIRIYIHVINDSFGQGGTLLCPNPVKTEFEGLGTGIYTGALLSLTNQPYTVKQAVFTDCYTGILNRLVTGGTIIHNEFRLGNLPDVTVQADQVGIVLNNTTEGFFIEENNFSTTAGNPNVTTVGISSFSLGSINKTVRRNTFSNVSIGNEAGGLNGAFDGLIPRGLHYDCNVNAGNIDYDFLVCDTDLDVDNVRAAQGLETGDAQFPFNAAGNQFTSSISTLDGHFSNQGGEQLDYFYLANAANQEPLSFSNIDPIPSINQNNCPVLFCAPDCEGIPDPGGSGGELLLYNDLSILYDDAVNARQAAQSAGDTTLAKQKTEEAAQHRYRMDTIAFQLTLFAMQDTLNFDRDTLQHRIGLLDDYGAEMMLAADLLEAGQSTDAYSTLAAAPTKFNLSSSQLSDLANVDTLFGLVAGQSLEELNGTSISGLEKIAVQGGEYAPGLAKNILELYKKGYSPMTCLHQDSNPEMLIANPGTNTTAVMSNMAEVFPNPASAQVTFRLKTTPDAEETITLTVMDFTGRVVLSYDFATDIGQEFSWLVNSAAPGIYFYYFKSKAGIEQSGKLILQ